jgi:hypothetical protein
MHNGLQLFAQQDSVQGVKKSMGVLSKRIDEVNKVLATITESMKGIHVLEKPGVDCPREMRNRVTKCPFQTSRYMFHWVNRCEGYVIGHVLAGPRYALDILFG